MMSEITVYTLPNCVQCDMTKKTLDKNHITYKTIDLSTDNEALQKIRDLGYQQAPVVIAGEKHWSGFKLDKIKALHETLQLKGLNKVMQTQAGKDLFDKLNKNFGSAVWGILIDDIEKIESELREIIKREHNG